MTVQELLTSFRNLADDGAGEDAFWSDDEFFEYLTEAEEQFARDTQCIIDGFNTTYTDLTVTADSEWITPNSKVLSLERPTLASTGSRLSILNWRLMDTNRATADDYKWAFTNDAAWETTTGTPRAIITDMDMTRYRLYPIPTANDTITATVRRMPAVAITGQNQTPEVPAIHHRELLYWCWFRAYSKQDAECFDPQAAASNFALWTGALVKAKRVYMRKYGAVPRAVRSSW